MFSCLNKKHVLMFSCLNKKHVLLFLCLSKIHVLLYPNEENRTQSHVSYSIV